MDGCCHSSYLVCVKDTGQSYGRKNVRGRWIWRGEEIKLLIPMDIRCLHRESKESRHTVRIK